jgi:hypothetical protein
VLNVPVVDAVVADIDKKDISIGVSGGALGETKAVGQ